MTPDTYTNQELFLDVGNGHQLYVHDWGNPKAKHPILFLHGGPGGSVSARHKMGFNPKLQRVIFFDQRGSGRSLPYGSLEHNTTADMVGDIEKILGHLKIPQIILTGGSWGACLALAFGLKHPRRVSAMVLNGIFTGSQAEIDHLDKGEFRTFFPDVWQRYLAATPKAHHKNPTKYHFDQALQSTDESAVRHSAAAYSNLEYALLSLDDRFVPNDPADPKYDPAGIRVEMHYLQNGCFMPKRHILDNAHKLHLPIWLVQGRYDMVCPPITAWELSQRLPHGKLIWTTSGHRAEREAWNVMRVVLEQLTERQA